MEGTRIGTVTHYYGNLSVAVIELTGTLQVGDVVHFLGRTSDFRQEVASLQIEHEAIDKAERGQQVAMQVIQRVRRRDKVFKLVE